MTTPTIHERLAPIVAEHLCVPVERVTTDARFEEDLSADSLDKVELSMAVEEEFDISLDDDEVKNATTVGDVVLLISKKTA